MIDWNAIDTVLLDMDGTLLDLHYDNYFWSTYLPKRYSEIKNIPLDDAQRDLQAHIKSLEGTLNWYCLEYWNNALALDLGTIKAEADIKHKIKERPHTLDFLRFLQKHSKTVILVTNAHPIGLDIKLTETSIGNHLNHIVSSHQFKYPKEEQAFWHQLQTHISFDPARSLFIDDNHAILLSAQKYGIAYNIGIHQPDSQTPRRLDGNLKGINAIHDFNEIM